MSVTDWIDKLAARWEIDDGQGGTVKSYRVYEKSEFPESIKIYPCAITYTERCVINIDVANTIAFWHGKTEFHLFPNVNKSNYPALMRYFVRIYAAVAGDLTLGGSVAYFNIKTGDTEGIQGPVVFQYGSEDPHTGLLVYWQVKELLSLTVA